MNYLKKIERGKKTEKAQLIDNIPWHTRVNLKGSKKEMFM